jgi:hypothetical protein
MWVREVDLPYTAISQGELPPLGSAPGTNFLQTQITAQNNAQSLKGEKSLPKILESLMEQTRKTYISKLPLLFRGGGYF